MHARRLLSFAAFAVPCAPGLGAQQGPPEPCDRYESAVRANPLDVQAAASLGRCSVSDYEMIAPGGDTARLAFRSSWSTALRALRRAVERDPTYAPAYGPLFHILFAETRDGCSYVTGLCLHVSPVLRDADSVITIPRPVQLNRADAGPYAAVIRESRAAARASLTEARGWAERWARVAPNDRRPHEYLGRALLSLGDAAAAVVALERAASIGTPASRRELFWDRMEALIKVDRGGDARRVLDEAADDPGRDSSLVRAYVVAELNALLGRHRPPPVDSARFRANRAELQRLFGGRRTPPRPAEPDFPELLAAGDTARARRALARLDSGLAPPAGGTRIPRVGPEHLLSAEYHLALGDTSTAQARLAAIEQPLEDHGRFRFSVSFAYGTGPPWLGRAWLLAGDLAAARERPETAARMYRRVVGLWGGGDPGLQPVVDQARAKLRLVTGR